MIMRLLKLIFLGTLELPGPGDWVSKDGLVLDKDAGTLTIDFRHLYPNLEELPDVWLPDIPDTNSMDPVFDAGHHNILIRGKTAGDHRRVIRYLRVGDIIVCNVGGGRSVIHRLVEIGRDDSGLYYRTQGDNVARKDPYIFRESDILWVSAGTIY